MEAKKSTTKYIAKPKLREVLHGRPDIKRLRDLADMTGVKEATISRFDSQARYDINTLVSVMKVLGIKNIEDLFDIEENDNFDQGAS